MANSPKSRFGDQPDDLHDQHGRDLHEGSPHRPESFDTMNPARLPKEDADKASPSRGQPAASATETAPDAEASPSLHGGERGATRGVGEAPGKQREGGTSQDDPKPDDTDAEEFPTDPETGGLPADHVRDAGPEGMEAPPEDWEQVDEESDESFPASDPPGNY